MSTETWPNYNFWTNERAVSGAPSLLPAPSNLKADVSMHSGFKNHDGEEESDENKATCELQAWYCNWNISNWLGMGSNWVKIDVELNEDLVNQTVNQTGKRMQCFYANKNTV